MTAMPPARRSPGRPQARSDAQTWHVIAEAARAVFARHGYAAASMDEVARTAGVSKKTLYRLIPTKAELFKAALIERVEHFILALDDQALAALPPEAALVRLMTEYGRLTLSVDTIAVTKLVLAESEKFPELAQDFYRHAVLATQTILTRFLQTLVDAKTLTLTDCNEAAGMLRGMMAMEPQRAVMVTGQAPPDEAAIARRAESCVSLFLHGCALDSPTARPNCDTNQFPN